MCLFVIAIFLILSAISYRLSHDFLHPAFITSLLWGGILCVYQFADHGLYPLSDKFYYAISLWVIPFCITSLLVRRIHIGFFPSLSGAHNKLVFLLYPVVGLSLILAIYGLYLKGLYYNADNIFGGIRAAGVASLNGEEEEFHYPFYISIALQFADMALLIALAMLTDKKNKIWFVLFVILLCIFFIFRSNKTVIAQLMCAFFVLNVLSGKVSGKKVLLFVSLGGVLMLIAHLLRSKDASSFDIINFISVYFLAPLPGFDAILNTHYDYINSFHGEYTFRFFVPYLQLLGFDVAGNPDPFNLHNWTYTPLPVNVYTAMFSYYVDFGYWGIFLFSIFGGVCWGILYKLAQKQVPVCKVLYSMYFYILIFQFFSDYFFQFLGANIMLMLIALLYYSHIVLRKPCQTL